MGVIANDDIIDAKVHNGIIKTTASYEPASVFNNGSNIADYAFHALAEVANKTMVLLLIQIY